MRSVLSHNLPADDPDIEAWLKDFDKTKSDNLDDTRATRLSNIENIMTSRTGVNDQAPRSGVNDQAPRSGVNDQAPRTGVYASHRRFVPRPAPPLYVKFFPSRSHRIQVINRPQWPQQPYYQHPQQPYYQHQRYSHFNEEQLRSAMGVWA